MNIIRNFSKIWLELYNLSIFKRLITTIEEPSEKTSILVKVMKIAILWVFFNFIILLKLYIQHMTLYLNYKKFIISILINE